MNGFGKPCIVLTGLIDIVRSLKTNIVLVNHIHKSNRKVLLLDVVNKVFLVTDQNQRLFGDNCFFFLNIGEAYDQTDFGL